MASWPAAFLASVLRWRFFANFALVPSAVVIFVVKRHQDLRFVWPRLELLRDGAIDGPCVLNAHALVPKLEEHDARLTIIVVAIFVHGHGGIFDDLATFAGERKPKRTQAIHAHHSRCFRQILRMNSSPRLTFRFAQSPRVRRRVHRSLLHARNHGACCYQ